MRNSMTQDIHSLADKLVKRLLDRGHRPCVLEDGTNHLGKLTAKEQAWVDMNAEPIRGALIRAKCYTKGTLDRIYNIEVFE